MLNIEISILCRTEKEADVSDSAMVLEICGDQQIVNPTDSQIREGLLQLDESRNDAFAILAASDMTYIQVAGDRTVGFLLEYQEGSLKEHYRAADDAIELERIVQTFILYRDGNDNWRRGFTFERETM